MHGKNSKKILSIMLAAVMMLGLLPTGIIAHAQGHTHTESCYAEAGALLCAQEETPGHTHEESCYCPGDEYICGHEESDEHEHTEECVCPGGELTCGLEESEGHTHDEDCYAKGGELICGLEETDSQDESKYSYIKDLFEADESIAYDAATQSIVVIDVSAAQSQFLQKLNIENAEQYIHEYDEYWFQMAINGDLLGEDYPYYYISNEDHTLEARRTAKKNNPYTWWSGVALETNDNTNGVIALVVDKGAEYKVSAPMEKWYMTNYTPVEPHEYTGSYGFVMNPLSYEDAFGYSGTADGDFTEISFHYEWDLINDIIGDITVANPDMKSIENAGYADIDTEVTLKVEIRDPEGNISLLPKRCYHVYSFWDYLQYMSEDGIIKVKTTSDDDGENKYGRFDFFIPIGYDYRVTVLDYGAGLKDYAYAYNWNQEYANDDDGFCTVEKDLTGDGWGTDEEFLFMPKTKEIRIEKVVDGADVSKDEKFQFQASHIVPVTKDKLTQPDKINVLSNYYYELFDSETNEPIPSSTPYKTDNNGCFELSVGQYAIFKTWVTPSDIADYEDWSCGFGDISASGSMPTETRYIFEELSQGEYSTTITQLSNGTETKIDGKVADHVVGGDALLYHNVFTAIPKKSGSLTIAKKVAGTGTPDAATKFEFTVTQNGNPASGQYSVNGGAEQPIPADGKIKLKADESAVLTGLEPGEYVVTETTPSQANYKSTAFSLNGGTVQDGTSATVTVTASSVGKAGSWKTENGALVKDEDGYFTYTLTADQIDAAGNITVDCDPIAEYMEAEMREYADWSPRSFKVKFVNETGSPIQYKDYSFDTVNWLPVGSTYVPSTNPSMRNTNEGANSSSAGYGWGEVWQQIYPMLIGQKLATATLNAIGFDGNQIRAAIAPLRCINPAVVSYFKSNPGNGTLTGNRNTNSAQTITLLQMNALPELIKQAFTFENWEGTEISLPADDSRTYADFICAFYGVQSLDELTVAQKYNVLGTGYKGSPAMPYAGQSHITTYYANSAGNMANWCIPYAALNDGTLDYFKTWGFSDTRIEEGKKLQSGGQTFSADDAALYAYQPDYYLMETDPEVLSMAYEYQYDRCIRFTLDADNRPISTAIDNSATSDAGVGGIKDYMDKTDAATDNVLAAMNGGAEIANGESVALNRVKGYIEVPNAWNQFRYYDFGFRLIFESKGEKPAPASVTFTNTYEDTDTPTPPTPDAKTGNLTVSKTVAGNAGDTTKGFTFTVNLSDKSINGTYGEMTFVNGVATFTLKHGEQKTASSLPAGMEYCVIESEANQNGYTTTEVGATGVIVKDAVNTAAFVNTKNHDGGSDDGNSYGNLTVTKTVVGMAGDINQKFTFTITLNRSISGKYGDMYFDKGVAIITLKHGESSTATKLPAGIQYSVVESGNDGYTVTTVGDTGTILDEKTAMAAFTNHKDGETPDNPTPDTPETPDQPNPDQPNTPDQPESPNVPVTPDQTPKTDDTWNPVSWAALMGLSLVGLIASAFAVKKNSYHGKRIK